MYRRYKLDSIEIARMAVKAADDKQANDILLLDAQPMCSFADYIVVCSADSQRQLKSIDEEISQSLKSAGIMPFHHEGTSDSGWLLLDYGSVIVHIFAEPEREFYEPEKLWKDMNTIVRIQ